MTVCRSSRDFDVTRTSSPVICVLTALGASSRMILVIFFAFSLDSPSLRVAARRYSLPDALGSLSRSEEHTSELQSRLHLVCRLPLEKKKKKNEHESTQNQRTATQHRPPGPEDT